MLLFKRLACGVISVLVILLGLKLIDMNIQTFQIAGACAFVIGISLSYIAILRRPPKYNFWITFIALFLGAILYNQNIRETKIDIVENKDVVSDVDTEKDVSNKKDATNKEDLSKNEEKNEKPQKNESIRKISTKKARKTSKSKLSGYPKISGSIDVIHPHIFRINGRYVKLFGVDAPDNDQICSDINEKSYNCGQEAVSWLREWIDDGIVDCYILKINTNGLDLVTCYWGDYDIAAGLVGSGWGIVNSEESNKYASMEKKARRGSYGLWQGTFYTPEDWRNIKRAQNDYTINRKSKALSSIKSLFKW